MKTLITSLIVSSILLELACSREDLATPKTGRASFSLSAKAQPTTGRAKDLPTPAFILLNIEDANGKPIETDKKLPLVSFGQTFITDNLELSTGSYKLTKFLVLDASDKIIYATPLAGSDLAQYVDDPLPINFNISENTVTPVIPQVIAVGNDQPESFGYASFGFEVIKPIKLTSVTFNNLFANFSFTKDSLIFNYNLQDKLQEINWTSFSYLNNQQRYDDTITFNEIRIYNNSNQLKEVGYSKSSQIRKYFYSQNNALTKIEMPDPYDLTETLDYLVLENTNGEITKASQTYHHDNSVWLITYKYDLKGNLIEFLRYNAADNNLYEMYTLKYDDI